ncbi:leucine-rich repeat neuronal protein 4 [Gastrophryne carolinensis]
MFSLLLLVSEMGILAAQLSSTPLTVSKDLTSLQHVTETLCATKCNNVSCSLHSRNLVEIPACIPHSVESLNLDFNNLAVIWDQNISNFSQLRNLSVAHNKIREVIWKSNVLPQLKVLDLSYNELTAAPKCLMLEKVEWLSLEGNPLSHIGPFTFTSFPNLAFLNLSSTLIGSNSSGDIDESAFALNKSLTQKDSLKSLKVLDLSNTYLTRVAEAWSIDLPNLEKLYLRNMIVMYSLEDELIQWFPQLEVLDFSGSQELTEVKTEIFGNASKLNCNLTSFPPWNLSSSDITVNLRGNPLTCSCELNWMFSDPTRLSLLRPPLQQTKLTQEDITSLRILESLSDHPEEPENIAEGSQTEYIRAFRKPSTYFPPLSMNSSIKTFINLVTQDIEEVDTKGIRAENFSPAQKQALKELADNPDIVIKPADKGGNTVIMTKEQYEKMCYKILENKEWYQKTSIQKIRTDQDEYNNIITGAYQHNVINKSTWEFLTHERAQQATVVLQLSLTTACPSQLSHGPETEVKKAASLIHKVFIPHETICNSLHGDDPAMSLLELHEMCLKRSPKQDQNFSTPAVTNLNSVTEQQSFTSTSQNIGKQPHVAEAFTVFKSTAADTTTMAPKQQTSSSGQEVVTFSVTVNEVTEGNEISVNSLVATMETSLYTTEPTLVTSVGLTSPAGTTKTSAGQAMTEDSLNEEGGTTPQVYTEDDNKERQPDRSATPSTISACKYDGCRHLQVPCAELQLLRVCSCPGLSGDDVIPDPPYLKNTSQMTDTSVQIHWCSPNSVVENYQLQYKPVGGQMKTINNVHVTMRQYTLYDLTPFTTYKVCVVAFNRRGQSDTENMESGTPCTEFHTKPSYIMIIALVGGLSGLFLIIIAGLAILLYRAYKNNMVNQYDTHLVSYKNPAFEYHLTIPSYH